MKKVFKVIRLEMMLASLALFIGCQSYQLTKTIGQIEQSLGAAKTDYEKIAYAVELAAFCDIAKEKEIEYVGCSQDLQPIFNQAKSKYAHNTEYPNIIALPLEGRRNIPTIYGMTMYTVGEQGLVEDIQNPYQKGYKICVTVFNLGVRDIRAIQLKVGIYDNFDKLIGQPLTLQESFPDGLSPYSSNRNICSANYYSDLSPVKVGNIKAFVDIVKYL